MYFIKISEVINHDRKTFSLKGNINYSISSGQISHPTTSKVLNQHVYKNENSRYLDDNYTSSTVMTGKKHIYDKETKKCCTRRGGLERINNTIIKTRQMTFLIVYAAG